MSYTPTYRSSLNDLNYRDDLIGRVQANLTAFETDITELERLWEIHAGYKTADPAMFEISVSLWKSRRKRLAVRLGEYWSAEHSTGRQWVTFTMEQETKRDFQPDRAVRTAFLLFRNQFDELVKRCEEVGRDDAVL